MVFALDARLMVCERMECETGTGGGGANRNFQSYFTVFIVISRGLMLDLVLRHVPFVDLLRKDSGGTFFARKRMGEEQALKDYFR